MEGDIHPLSQCRVGEWLWPEEVPEWCGLSGLQSFQPNEGFRDFAESQPLWLFQLEQHPKSLGVIWRRVS
jgi:hypothetical protein